MAIEAIVKVQVEGAPSGNERLREEGQLPTEQAKQVSQQETVADKTKEKERFNNIRDAAIGGAVVVGNAGLQIVEQNNRFKGDSNTATRINEAKKWYGRGALIIGATARFGPLGGLTALATTAYGLALENRELLFERSKDTYTSNYWQNRLIRDVSGRSR